MATLIFNSEGRQIRKSRNLAGMLAHARREVPKSATLESLPPDVGNYRLTVHFANGDSAVSPFADWRVAADWLAARRTWPDLAAFGLPEFVARYTAARGEAETLRALLADLVSGVCRNEARSGNPWRADTLKRAAEYLNARHGEQWSGDSYRGDCSPMETAARRAQYAF